MAKAPFNLEEYKSDLEIIDVFGEELFNHEEILLDMLDVNGMGKLYGEGAKTVLPSKPMLKFL